MKKFKGLIFDFNGVLVFDQHLHDEIWNVYAEKITGKRLTDSEIKNLFHGRTNKGVLEYLYNRELGATELQQMTSEKELLYQDKARSLGAEYELSPGATELLNALKVRHIPFTISTSSPKMNVDFFNEMFHLDAWFDMGNVAFDDGKLRGKPAPDLYLRAAELISLAPGDCVVIEDARSGIAAAHAAGIGHIIAIGPKESHEDLRKVPGVSEVIENLSEVLVSTLF